MSSICILISNTFDLVKYENYADFDVQIKI